MKKILLIAGLLILAPTISFAMIDTNLSYGARGTAVTELQNMLISKGFLNTQASGNFYSLARYLYDNKKLLAILSPHRSTCSSLLRKSAKDKMTYMDSLQEKLSKRKSTT